MSTPPGVASTDHRWLPGYREWLPPAQLRDAIACLWVSVSAPDAAPSVTAVLPDGCADLIWQRGRGAFVAGPDTGPAPADMPPGTIFVGARFWPGAGGPALGLPLAHLRDQRVDLADAMPRLVRHLPADLTPAQALAAMTRLSAQLVAAAPPDQLVVAATRLLASSPAGVTDLSRALAVSERQLRRRFDVAVGYGPKTMQRVLRFRRVIGELTAAPRSVDLADLAVRAGYADQAHLTRETARLAGLPPAALARSFVTSQSPPLQDEVAAV
jgi:AraC-like DNA-binding protein